MTDDEHAQADGTTSTMLAQLLDNPVALLFESGAL